MTTYKIGTYNGVHWRRCRVSDACYAMIARKWMYYIREPGHPLQDNGYRTLADLTKDVDKLSPNN